MPDAGEQKIVFRSVSFNHPISIAEIDLVVHAAITEKDTHHFDFSVFTQNTIIRVYERINTTDYRVIGKKIYPTDFETDVTGVTIILDGAGQDMKITLQSEIVESAIRTVVGTIRDEIRI